MGKNICKKKTIVAKSMPKDGENIEKIECIQAPIIKDKPLNPLQFTVPLNDNLAMLKRYSQ